MVVDNEREGQRQAEAEAEAEVEVEVGGTALLIRQLVVES